jgi:two-component sensor histidine kinase
MSQLSTQNAYLTEMLKQAGLDAEARIDAQRIQAVLTDEIHHRMKNMLSMVAAIVRQSIRSATSLAGAERAISTRLIAMARAHDLLLKADLKSAGLNDVIQGAIAQHNDAAGAITIAGEEMQVTPSAILPLTLIINELCTNATKHGALSQAGGAVRVNWGQDAAHETFLLRWVEKGGPTVRIPDVRHLGSRLLEEAIPHQMGGFGRLSFPAGGAEFALTLPLAKLLPADLATTAAMA